MQGFSFVGCTIDIPRSVMVRKTGLPTWTAQGLKQYVAGLCELGTGCVHLLQCSPRQSGSPCLRCKVRRHDVTGYQAEGSLAACRFVTFIYHILLESLGSDHHNLTSDAFSGEKHIHKRCPTRPLGHLLCRAGQPVPVRVPTAVTSTHSGYRYPVK